MLNIVLFGPPGAGKGTQSEKLIAKYQLVHLSTGDIFRANIKGETDLGKLAKSYMDNGQLVPDSVTISMLEAEVNKYPNAKGFIFDGFPRTQAQAQALDNLLKSKGTAITLMLALEVEEEELRKRLLLRGQNSGRPDDQNPEVIQKRIDVYNNETAPVKNFYTAQGKYKGVYGIGEIETIFNALCSVIDTSIASKVKSVTAAKAVVVKKAKVPAKKVAKKAVKKTTKKKVSKPVKKKSVKKAAVKKSQKVTKPIRKVAKKAVKKKIVRPAKKKVVKKSARPAGRAAKPVRKTVKKVLKKNVKAKAKKVIKKNSKIKTKKNKGKKK